MSTRGNFVLLLSMKLMFYGTGKSEFNFDFHYWHIKLLKKQFHLYLKYKCEQKCKETHPHKRTVYAGVWCLYSFFDGFTTNKYGSYIICGILDPFFKL